MSEEQIVAELAKRTQEPVVEEPVIEETPPEEPQNFVDKLLPEEQLTRGQLLDWFQVPMNERHTAQLDRWINEIYSWARETAGSGEYTDLLRVINEQEQVMGSRMKPGRVVKLYKYIQIAKARRQLAAHERLLYG